MTYSTRICLLCNCIVICGQCSCYLYSLTHTYTLTHIDTDWLCIVRVCALLGLHTFFIHTIHITINIYDTFIYKRKRKPRKRCEEALVNGRNLIITFVSYLNENSRRMDEEARKRRRRKTKIKEKMIIVKNVIV